MTNETRKLIEKIQRNITIRQHVLENIAQAHISARIASVRENTKHYIFPSVENTLNVALDRCTQKNKEDFERTLVGILGEDQGIIDRTYDDIEKCEDAGRKEYLEKKIDTWSTQYRSAFKLLEESLKTPYADRAVLSVEDAIKNFRVTYLSHYEQRRRQE